uniref:Uncharacterized protein n=1 Tax=Ciona savignyi TaxID=51511 RepID=H2Z6N2_CIOSA
MFKKLRQKLENDETTSSPGKDTRRDERKLNSSLSAAQHRKSSSNLIRSDSLASLTSSEPEMPTESSSREEISSMLIHRTTQVKRLEVKLAEYGQTLKERSRECEKLSVALEKQQDSALRKLGELNDTYAKDRKRSEATITKLETEENKLTATVEELKEENEKLKKSVDEWEKGKDVFERMKSEFF